MYLGTILLFAPAVLPLGDLTRGGVGPLIHDPRQSLGAWGGFSGPPIHDPLPIHYPQWTTCLLTLCTIELGDRLSIGLFLHPTLYIMHTLHHIFLYQRACVDYFLLGACISHHNTECPLNNFTLIQKHLRFVFRFVVACYTTTPIFFLRSMCGLFLLCACTSHHDGRCVLNNYFGIVRGFFGIFDAGTSARGWGSRSKLILGAGGGGG